MCCGTLTRVAGQWHGKLRVSGTGIGDEESSGGCSGAACGEQGDEGLDVGEVEDAAGVGEVGVAGGVGIAGFEGFDEGLEIGEVEDIGGLGEVGGVAAWCVGE